MKSTLFLMLFAITLNSFAQSTTEKKTKQSVKKENPFVNKNGNANAPQSKGIGGPHPNINIKNETRGRDCEIMPMFPGGDLAYFKFLKANQKYPKVAIQNREEGCVYVRAVVWKDGSIRNTKIIKGASKSLNNEAIRLINIMPKWTPGQLKGKSVGCAVHLPITFKL